MMINQCANPKCCKPLHYLREGRIFVFDLPDPDAPTDGGHARRLRHYWLCGPCSATMVMEQTSEVDIQVKLKSGKVQADIFPGSLTL